MIRYATTQDIPAMTRIYAYYVEHSVATFAYHAPTLEEFHQLFQELKDNYPFLVYVKHDQVIGYAYAHRYKDKEAYQWDVEITIYVDIQQQKQQIGTKLLKELLCILRKQHVRNVYSCITVPNEGSIALHQKYGFEEIAYLKATGYKHGTWLDVVWLQRILCKEEHPQPFLAIDKIKTVSSNGS